MRIIILFLTSFIVVGIFAGAYFWKSSKHDSLQVPVVEIQNTIFKPNPIPTTPTPTPPFYELTTPYLRERTYVSSLGTLEKVSENSQYISYLTSYNSDGLKINGQLTIPKQDSGVAEFTPYSVTGLPRMTEYLFPG